MATNPTTPQKESLEQWQQEGNSIASNGFPFGSLCRSIEHSIREIEYSGGVATETEREDRVKLIQEVDDLDRSKSMDLAQKARVTWETEGDENTKVFHGMINQRRRKQSIQGILINGVWISDPHHVKTAFLKFYHDKFKAQTAHVNFGNHLAFKSISPSERISLEGHVSVDEIREAVWDCGSEKAPGPDDFSFLFLKKFWELLKHDVERFVMDFFATSRMPMGVNSAFITLIPKLPNPDLITDFWPISLIGLQHKIVAKILANRLAKVVHKLVSPEQSAFISGRQILDGPLMLSEIIDWYKKRGKKRMVFKVDFEKAYDSVSWKYLDHVLNQFGFGSKWRGWIRECLYSARTSIMVNGSPTAEFSLNRGLRQGDPLSPFLFILIMEGLYIAIEDAVHQQLISGVNIGATDRKITITFFWGGDQNLKKMSWIKWENILESLEKGDLGVGSLKAFNLALLQKWRWRFVTQLDMLWVKLFKAIRGTCLDLKGCSSNGVWAKIVGSFNTLHSSGILANGILKCKVGDGASVRFWKDTWLGDEPLSIRYNRLFRLDSNEECLIKERLVNGSNILDSWQWLIGKDSFFAVSETRKHIYDIILPSTQVSTRWCKALPRKVNIFMWRLRLDRMPHRLNLSKRDMDINSILCSVCNNGMESSEHLFCSCEVAVNVWRLIRLWRDAQLPVFNSQRKDVCNRCYYLVDAMEVSE
ncbi:putative RNA-directed DNA polymerase, eukaryota, reverse transcriptase zinc-binding domain protein [Tanacetum coccineum]|uniref:RNA-directed DNA polymerase, eukaryota, reverse transcriptase zinc-binding domain protein n=1 Tax=Tanacetum coccineum TaxID=301880 RepID=A0ABQ5GQL8_9ASTR